MSNKKRNCAKTILSVTDNILWHGMSYFSWGVEHLLLFYVTRMERVDMERKSSFVSEDFISGEL